MLLKAKKLEVGSKRKWKSGWWLKDRPGHWKLLREQVTKKYRAAGVHPNHPHAKAMFSAATKVIRHFANSRMHYSDDLASVFIDNNYSHLKDSMGRYGLWKKHTLDAVKRYLKEMGAVYGEGNAREPSDTSKKIEQWQSLLKESSLSYKSQADMDEFVSKQFASRKKKIAHLLFAARQFVGADTPLSQVPEQGFKGFCKAMIVKFYEHGPAGVSQDQLKIWEKAFNTVFDNAHDGQGSRLMPLAKALTHANTDTFWRQHPKWFVYCCTRQAMKNDGMVDLKSISTYIKNSRKFHGTKNPPSPTYDQTEESVLSQIRLGMLEPKKAKVQQERMFPTKMDALKKLYLKKRRLGKSLAWSGKGPDNESAPIADQDEDRKRGKISRMLARLRARRTP